MFYLFLERPIVIYFWNYHVYSISALNIYIYSLYLSIILIFITVKVAVLYERNGIVYRDKKSK